VLKSDKSPILQFFYTDC